MTKSPSRNIPRRPVQLAEMDRDRRVERVILVEGFANLAVLSMKLLVASATGSLAVLGDALHSSTDVANNVMAWAVIRISTRPSDRGHPYGHRKFETLAVFVLASLLTVLAFELAMHALRRDSAPVQTSGWALALMLATLLVNVLLAWWERHWARRLDSEILRADAHHTLADVLTTVVVIAGWQLSAHGYPWLDSLCAMLAACLVLYLAYTLFKRAVPVLVDSAAIDAEQLANAIAAVEGVKAVHRLRSRWIGSAASVNLTITVDAELSTQDSHRIADDVERMLEERFNVVDAHIHVEPI
jgi:cation diffusion facilitator family transporter